MPTPKRIHPNAPKKLKAAYIEAGRNVRALARDLEVNPFYVQQALKKNQKPSNKKLQYKLFFIDRKKREPVPEWKKQLRKIPKDKKENIFKALLSGKYKIVKKEN